MRRSRNNAGDSAASHGPSPIDAVASLAEEIDDNTLDDVQAGLDTAVVALTLVPVDGASNAPRAVCTVGFECSRPRPL